MGGLVPGAPPMDSKILRCSSSLYKMSIHGFSIHRTEGQLYIVLHILTNILSCLCYVITVHCDYTDIEYFLFLYRQDLRIFSFLPPQKKNPLMPLCSHSPPPVLSSWQPLICFLTLWFYLCRRSYEWNHTVYSLLYMS